MIDAIGNRPLPTPGIETPQKGKDTARQFEALLIGELLKASRSSRGGWLGTGDADQAGQMGLEIAEQEFARMLAAKGGLGMGQLIERGMK